VLSSTSIDILSNLYSRILFAHLSILKLKKGDIDSYRKYSEVLNGITKDELLKEISCAYTKTSVWGEIRRYVEKLQLLAEQVKNAETASKEEIKKLLNELYEAQMSIESVLP